MLNQNPNTFTFNGHSSDEFGIRIERKPDLNRSGRKYKSATVNGRNGNIYQLQDAWDEVTVAYHIYAGGREKGDVLPAFTDIIEWLNSADDYAVLTDSYDPEHYRLAVFVDSTDIESQWYTIGEATIKFRCQPQRYLCRENNYLPLLWFGESSGSGMSVTVDDDGTATLSGTSNAQNGTVSVRFDQTYTISQSLAGAKIHLNNSEALEGVTVQFCKKVGSSIIPLYTISLNKANKVIDMPQSLIGETLYCMYVVASTGTTLSGTIYPELINIEPYNLTVSSGNTVVNPTKHIALPIITLTGSEIVTSMLDLEKPYGYTLDISATSTWTNQYADNIGFQRANYNSNSNRWQVTTYRQEGTPTAEGASITTHVNSTGTLTFKPFRWVSNDVGVGRGITLTPDTDYTISCTTTAGDSKVWVGFFESDGSKYCNSSAEATRSGEGQLSLTFHVPSNCSNTLFIFYRTDNTTGTFSSIMLASGTEVIPFQPYATEATETITIGNTTLQFTTSGFNTTVIDCEKENFTVDGVNYNGKSTILDQYGNYSEEYLKLDKGDNTVTYTSDIASVTIEPRFWEL